MASEEFSPPKGWRITPLDTLRGTYILLACWQHFFGQFNFHNRPLASNVERELVHWLVPSGEHIFLALAAFNLAHRSSTQFAGVYFKKLRDFFIIFLLFYFEQFLRTDTLGEALSFGPLQAWMLTLAIIATLYRVGSWQGVAALFVTQLFFWILPVSAWGAAFDNWFAKTFGLLDYNSTPLHLFIGSGCVGFLCGYLFLQSSLHQKRSTLGMLAAGLLAVIVGWSQAPSWNVNPDIIYVGSFSIARSFAGIVGIWGVLVTLFGLLLSAHLRGISLWLPVITWCGLHSLFIFFLHEVFFVRVLFPLREQLSIFFDLPHGATVVEMTIHALIIFFVVWCIRRWKILEMLSR